MTMLRSYQELSRLKTFEERFEYLKLGGVLGRSTFGFDRWVNQWFYTSREWRSARDKTILRDEGRDLGVEGFDIMSGLLVHHMNPITLSDIENGEEWICDPEFLITTTHKTHNAIHYGTKSPSVQLPIERTPGDTKLW